MVILHVKRTNPKHEFLFECSVNDSCADVLSNVSKLHNMRIKALRLSAACKELAEHGPLRPEETRGISEDVGKISELDVHAYGKPTHPDEYGYRTGCPPIPETAEILLKTAAEAEVAVSVNLVAQRKCLTVESVQSHLDCMRGAVMIAYPAYHRLPAFDPVRVELEDKEELDGSSDLQDQIPELEAALWWAGKELQRGKQLHEFLGKNEKTKVVAKLVGQASGAPVREPRIDEETHKAMLSYYYKRQEEVKKLDTDDDDSYLSSHWANPKALKSSIVGGGGGEISWKFK